MVPKYFQNGSKVVAKNKKNQQKTGDLGDAKNLYMNNYIFAFPHM